LINERLDALGKKRPKPKDSDLDQLWRQSDTVGKKIRILKSYKVVASLLFVTNLFLISAIIPEFRGKEKVPGVFSSDARLNNKSIRILGTEIYPDNLDMRSSSRGEYIGNTLVSVLSEFETSVDKSLNKRVDFASS
jgi:hypothetical protein